MFFHLSLCKYTPWCSQWPNHLPMQFSCGVTWAAFIAPCSPRTPIASASVLSTSPPNNVAQAANLWLTLLPPGVKSLFSFLPLYSCLLVKPIPLEEKFHFIKPTRKLINGQLIPFPLGPSTSLSFLPSFVSFFLPFLPPFLFWLKHNHKCLCMCINRERNAVYDPYFSFAQLCPTDLPLKINYRMNIHHPRNPSKNLLGTI